MSDRTDKWRLTGDTTVLQFGGLDLLDTAGPVSP
jgi:hypothetical protein